MLFFFFYLLLGSLFCSADIEMPKRPTATPQRTTSPAPYLAPAIEARSTAAKRKKSDEQLRLEIMGLVNVQDIDADIQVRLAYAGNQNLLGVQLYNGLNEAYLQPDAAWKLAIAQKVIKGTRRNLSILVHDAARPQHVQQRCWELAGQRNMQYLFSNPDNISMHTYGVAIDVSLIDTNTGLELDMGCPVDAPGVLAAPRYEENMIADGRLTIEQFDNRTLLRNAMTFAGFSTISNEWWHFEACSRQSAEALYKPIP
ncbi:MAG: D-alanyl-D-alanine dipeptidase [Prevotellaceae bacterium]|jgi:D-alanyl-D-alanine dipeptidase|nr:D-alanyl-D-alanine dipeptidase [Prevotellaceae bacterium]